MTARSILLATLAAASISGTAAVAFDGRYVSGTGNYRQSLTIARGSGGTFTVKAEVSTPGCIGELDGIGTAKGNTLVVKATEPDDDCVFTLSRKGNGLTGKERQCTMWHGMRCGFDGDYRKR